jgi:hypothetical protein
MEIRTMLISSWLSNWKGSLERRSARSQNWRHRSPIRRFAPRLFLEALEDRTLLSAYVVTTTADSGAGSLRDAINRINADTSHAMYASPGNPNVDEIDFNITAASDTGGGFNATTGIATIQPQTALPQITNAVVINGYTQGHDPSYTPAQETQYGASANTLTTGDNAVLKVVLDGSLAGYADVDITGGNSTVRGLVVGGGILLSGGRNDFVTGNFIGTDSTGTIPKETGGIGIESDNNTIGGTDPADRNIITASGFKAVEIESNGNYVEGNYIGIDATGMNPLLNSPASSVLNSNLGVFLIGASHNTIGGSTPGAGNVIAGWGNDIFMQGSGDLGQSGYMGSTNNLVQGNYLGTNAAGTAFFSPNYLAGVTSIPGCTSNTIAGNLIAGHYQYGISLYASGIVEGNRIENNGSGIICRSGDTIQGNLIGTDATGTQAFPNGVGIWAIGNNNQIGGTTRGDGNVIAFNDGPAVLVYGTGNPIEGNSIFGNNDTNGHTGQPIDNLGQDRDSLSTLFEQNWPGGPFTGTDSASFSGLTVSQTGSTLTYNGSLTNGLPSMRYLVTLAANSSDGKYWGSDYVYLTTDASGQVPFTISFPAPWGTSNSPGKPSAFEYVAHSLGNYEQNYPVLSSAFSSASDTSIIGTLNGQANTAFRIEFFSNPAKDPSGYGQGQTYLDYANVTTDANGNVTFTADLAVGNLAGQWITATATDPNGNTSEFAADVKAMAAAAGYAVLYEGTGGHNLSITNVTVNGGIGVGGTGAVQFSGPGTISGSLDFSAANSGQFHNTNDSNVGPTSTNYNVAPVTNALNTVNSLNGSLAGLGNSLAISGNQTINESTGQLETVNGVTYRVFAVTSYSEGNGNLLTIHGDGSGNPVVLNFGFNSNVNLGGDVSLTGGLTDDQVLWNFTTSGKNISLNNNASSYPLPAAFHGIILAPHDAISLSNANLDGRVFGGDSSDMQIVSGDTINAPATAPPYLFFAGNLQAALPQSSTTANTMTIQASASMTPATVIQAVNGLTNVTHPVTIILDLGGGTYSTGGVAANPPPHVTFVIQNGTLDPAYPALTVAGGQVAVLNSTLTTTGDAPTLLVTGGSVTLRGDVVQESTGFSDAAIAISGGTLDLGTAASPGGNTLNVNGAGQLVLNSGPSLVTALGNSFAVNGAAVKPVTTTALTSSSAISTLNQPVTFTAAVSAPGTGSVTPTGNVTFLDLTTGTTLALVPLSAGSAQWTTSALPVNAQTIAAVYSGDASYITSAATVAQRVHYQFGGFLPPLGNGLTFAMNRTIPLKFQLSDFNGNAVSSLSAVMSLQVQALDANGNPVGAPFNPALTDGTGLSNSGGQYLFNWQTKGLAAGSYQIVLTLTDGTTQTKTIQLTANGSSAGLVTGSSGGTATAGALLGGEVDLYVDNSNGDLTSDELNRIQDAVNAVDATIAPYGVIINEVSDPTQANVTLNMNTTSALGGVAQGVLGCTTDADQVTMIQGWNWYAGSDPTQIGAGQYDFETAVMHELGHVLGLGHSSTATSVMYSTLATGLSNRALVAADLNVPDSDSGPCALHAAPAVTVVGTSNGPGLSAPSSLNVPARGSSSSGVNPLFAALDGFLSHAWNASQSEWSSLSALWQQVDALALQRVDTLLSLEAGAMGVSKDTLRRALLLASNGSPNG